MESKNTNRGRMVRSGLGGFLGALLAIIPASVWNMYWLCLVGGVVGWAFGYHGDRIFYGLYRGWQECQNKIGSMLRALGTFIDVLFGKLPSAGTSVESIFKFFKAIETFLHGFVNVVDVICSWLKRRIFLPLIKLPLTVRNFYNGHPVNRILLIRYTMMLVCISMTVPLIYGGFTVLGPQVGDLKEVRQMQPRLVIEHVPYTEEMVTEQRNESTFLLSIFVLLVMVLIFVVKESESSQAAFYKAWETYQQSKWRFFMNELIYIGYVMLWAISYTATSLAILFIGMIGFLFIGLISLMIILSGLRFSWYLVRVNKDYGWVSLIIALIVGSTTFLVYREQLVSNMGFLLGTSFTAAFVSGAVSMGFTYLGNLVFCRSERLRNFLTKKDDDDIWVMDQSFDILTRVGKFFFPYLDKLMRKTMPVRRKLYVF